MIGSVLVDEEPKLVCPKTMESKRNSAPKDGLGPVVLLRRPDGESVHLDAHLVHVGNALIRSDHFWQDFAEVLGVLSSALRPRVVKEGIVPQLLRIPDHLGRVWNEDVITDVDG